MSEFQKSLFQNKLRALELQLGFNFGEDLEDEEENDSVSPLPNSNITTSGNHGKSTTKEWQEFFDSNEIYETESHFKFQTYYKKPMNNNKNPVIFICHHGAGSSGLTFGVLSKSLQNKFAEKNGRKLNPEEHELPGLFTFDIRGHSKTALLNTKETDFSMRQLSLDFVFLFQEFLKKNKFEEGGIKPSIFLVGHSLGGSVLTNVIHQGYIEGATHLDLVKGLVMLDIVEEAAVKSLHAMTSYLDKTPKSFKTMLDCVQWHLDAKLVNNKESAELSVPSYFQYDQEKKLFYWIADLYSTQPFWNEWFTGLSSNFVSIKSSIAKLLILSGHDNLDKYLMIGQMQGKYQLVVFQNQVYVPELHKMQHCGHFVQEDCPDKVALTLIDYVERNDFSRSEKSINIKWGSMR